MSFQNCKIAGVGVNPDQYHNHEIKRGDPKHPVSPSMLREFGRCPSRWKAGYEMPASKSKTFGSLFDCLLLTPADLSKRYAVTPLTYDTDALTCPKCGSESDAAKCRKCGVDRVRSKVTAAWNAKSNTCQAWRAEQEQAGRAVVSAADDDEIRVAACRLLADPTAKAWHEACDKQVLVEGEWADEGTGLVVPVRCLLDYAPRLDSEFAECLGDLKTASSGELRQFTRSAYSFGYHIQAGFDLLLFNAATGEKRDKWCFIGVENYLPFEPFKRMFDEEFVNIGRQKAVELLRRYCKALATDTWPGYDDHPDAVQGWSIVCAEPWMAYDAVADKMAAGVLDNLTTEQKLDMAGL